MKDIQFIEDNSAFNCRVNALIIKDNKILLTRLKTDDFWTFIGGKIQFGESSEQAVLREVKEETGAELQIDKTIALIENFFHLRGKDWHQYIFFYKLKADLEVFEGSRDLKDDPRGEIKWFSLDELNCLDIRPVCCLNLIDKPFNGVMHIINKEY